MILSKKDGFLDPLQFKQPLMLDIGAGGYSGDLRFTSIDAYTEADINAMMWDIPLPDGSVTNIFCNNALEHISKFDVVPTLREWNRLLKVGGILQLIVPDLEWACRYWLAALDVDWGMDIIYGHQLHEGEYHKTGFTQKILWDYFLASNPGGWFVKKLEYRDGKIDVTDVREDSISVNANQRLIYAEAIKVDEAFIREYRQSLEGEQ